MKTFWRILKLLGDYKWLTILGFALAFAQMGLSLVVPWIIGLTTNALMTGNTGMLVTYSLALLGIATSASSSPSADASPPARPASASSTTCATACGRTCSVSPPATSTAGPPAS